MDTSNKGEKPKLTAENPTADVAVTLPWSKVQKKDWLEESLADHFHCILCGSELRFEHKTNFADHVVVEDAHCSHCRVRNRQSMHVLQ